MAKEKHIGLLFVTIVAVVLVFATTRVEALSTCTSEELSDHTCAYLNGYDIKVVQPGFGSMDDEGNVTFLWNATQVDTSKNISAFDILVPICNAGNAVMAGTGNPSGWHHYGDYLNYPYSDTAGEGSPNGFGLGDTQDYVFEISFNGGTGSYVIKLVTTRAAVGATSIGAKIGPQLYVGTILGPACYVATVGSTTEQTFEVDPSGHPGVKLTVKKQSNGTVVSVTAEDKDHNPLTVTELSLKDYPYWVCTDANWHLDSNNIPQYDGCNEGLSPVTHIPEGAFLKFGNNTWISVNIGGRTYLINI